jgi:tRNA acetyltransferase TAN1
MYNFNLLVSHSWGTFGQAKNEIMKFLKEFGDDNPIIEKTSARGICGVKTRLKSREVIKKIRDAYKKDPLQINFAIKWVPADNWCRSDLNEMKKLIKKIKIKIKKGEKWGMEVEKRRYTQYHADEIIKELAKGIKEKVDLEHPDKILRIDIIGENAGISVLRPEEIFSTRKPI